MKNFNHGFWVFPILTGLALAPVLSSAQISGNLSGTNMTNISISGINTSLISGFTSQLGTLYFNFMGGRSSTGSTRVSKRRQFIRNVTNIQCLYGNPAISASNKGRNLGQFWTCIDGEIQNPDAPTTLTGVRLAGIKEGIPEIKDEIPKPVYESLMSGRRMPSGRGPMIDDNGYTDPSPIEESRSMGSSQQQQPGGGH